MKKLLILLLLFAGYLGASAQGGWLKPNNSYGTISNRADIDSLLFFPTGCGAPTSLKGYDLKHYAIYGDSCGHHVYFYDPSTTSWSIISGGGSGSYHFNGDSTFYLGGDTLLHSLNSNLAGGDTTVFQTVVDSTGQPGQRILWSAGNKIKSSKYLLFDSTQKKVVIGNTNISVGGTATKLYVVGNTIVNGNLTATKFIKVGGTSAQYLMADGSVTTSAGGSTTSVDSLKHLFVDTSASPRNNYVLAFDSTGHKWYLKQDATGGAGTPDTVHVQNKGAGTTLAYTNGSDTLFSKNIQAGTNITLTPNPDSSLTISASGGSSTIDQTVSATSNGQTAFVFTSIPSRYTVTLNTQTITNFTVSGSTITVGMTDTVIGDKLRVFQTQ